MRKITKIHRNTNHKNCVFISHKSEDKDACIRIADYLDKAGIGVYLDCHDSNLQIATANQDMHAITDCVKEGIQKSTHMLCVLSKKTYTSKWVPFEIGYGHATLRDKDLDEVSQKWRISILRLEDFADENLPDYLKIAPDIRGNNEFNDYLNIILNSSESSLIMENRIIKAFGTYSHPLEGILSFKY